MWFILNFYCPYIYFSFCPTFSAKTYYCRSIDLSDSLKLLTIIGISPIIVNNFVLRLGVSAWHNDWGSFWKYVPKWYIVLRYIWNHYIIKDYEITTSKACQHTAIMEWISDEVLLAKYSLVRVTYLFRNILKSHHGTWKTY